MTKSQGSPFFFVIRCTLPSRKPVVEGSKDGAVRLCSDLMGRRIFGIRVQREFSLNALAELYEVSFSSRYPNSPTWIRGQLPCRRNLRRRKHLTHLEIADANKLLRFVSTLCPDVPVDVLDQPKHHTKR